MTGPVTALALALASAPAHAGDLQGKVLGGGLPVVGSTITLWQASAEAPKEIATTTSGADGSFSLSAPAAVPDGNSLYLIAIGGTPDGKAENKAIALLSVLGETAPATVTINEMTTVAAVWTHNQFITGDAVSGQPLQLKIAAGNVPIFVDLATGGWGGAIPRELMAHSIGTNNRNELSTDSKFTEVTVFQERMVRISAI